jgi:hypothetical protein
MDRPLMAVTPNYSWPVPVATDFVKDGWEAISDLGNAIDTTVSGLGSAGFTKVIPTSVTKGASGTASVSTGGVVTFAGTESISINGCFSSTFDNYRFIVNLTNTASTPLRGRMRTGSDDTGAVYDMQRGEFDGSSSNFVRNVDNTTIILTSTNTSGFRGNLEFLSPNLAANTAVLSQALTTSGNTPYLPFSGTRVDSTTEYTGFSFIPDSGLITGTISVYGYQL